MDSWDAIGYVAEDKMKKITKTEKLRMQDCREENTWVNPRSRKCKTGVLHGIFVASQRAIAFDGNRRPLALKKSGIK